MKKIVLLLILFSAQIIFAENINLNITYLGMPAVNVNMAISDSLLSVSAKSVSITKMLAKMDNLYEVKFTSTQILPIYYKKIIKQNKYSEDRITFYNRKKLIGSRKSFLTHTSINYKINEESRDFFSSLLLMRKINGQKHKEIYLDANTRIWKADLTLVKTENIATKIGNFECNKYQIKFKKISHEKKERSDMLTNNLVNEKGILYFWITNDGRNIPVLAKYSRKPFPVYWKIKSYEN